jgi:hypothetical protein
MKSFRLAGYALLLFSTCVLLSARPASSIQRKKTEYSFYAMNNSGNGCITSINGITGFSLSSPLCDGGSVETTFTEHGSSISGYVSGDDYYIVECYGSETGFIGNQIIYDYGSFDFNISGSWENFHESFSLYIYPLNP